MNEKITFPRLASLLADRSGRSKRFSEDFLREFFALISEMLEAGESVKVKGLGTFRLSRVEPRRSIDVTTGQPMEISGHTKVVFVPAKELAEAVNSPFEAFSAIEISDQADLSQIFSEDDIVLRDEVEGISEDSQDIAHIEFNTPSSTTTIPEAPQEEKSKIEEDTVEGEDETEQNDRQAEKEAETAQQADSLKEDNGECNEAQEQGEYSEAEEELNEEDSTPKKSWLKILMISLGAAIIALIATLGVWYIFAPENFHSVFQKSLLYVNITPSKKGDDSASSKEIAAAASAVTAENEEKVLDSLSSLSDETDVPTAPSDAVVYDTIGTTRYLTTMAKSHYGNYNFWPYIYEENKAFLGHPDRIRPGTQVVIPKLNKYGVNPVNEQDIEKAKKMGVEIYARYGKKI